jgi:hypothetical protein
VRSCTSAALHDRANGPAHALRAESLDAFALQAWSQFRTDGDQRLAKREEEGTGEESRGAERSGTRRGEERKRNGA